MSEYQYYEFRTVDRPLTSGQMDELREISSRAEITPTGLTNEYSWGNFKGDPDDLMDRYFDAFVYVANWGTHRLMFRVPRGLLDVRAAEAFCEDEFLTVRAEATHVVLEFVSEDEEGEGWIEGDEWMPSLISLRAELIRGDLRALYLGWLASVPIRDGEEDGESLEPPVPPGLAKPSAALKALAEFLRIDDEWIAVAAEGNPAGPPPEPSRADLARWIAGLPAAEKDGYLVRFLADEADLAVRAEMSRKFRAATAPKGKKAAPEPHRRTVAELRAAFEARIAEKTKKAEAKAAKERAERDRTKAEERARRLDALSRREAEAWRDVERKIASTQQTQYDEAVELLVDLRDLAARSGRQAEALAKIQEIRLRHRRKSSFVHKLDAKGLR